MEAITNHQCNNQSPITNNKWLKALPDPDLPLHAAIDAIERMRG